MTRRMKTYRKKLKASKKESGFDPIISVDDTDSHVWLKSTRGRMSLAIDDIAWAHEDVCAILEYELSKPEKEYHITYKNKSYLFRYYFDREENLQNKKQMKLFIRDIVHLAIRDQYSVSKSKREHAWDIVFGIIGGANEQEHKIEKYVEDEVINEDGQIITSVPLNLDNYQVKENLGMLDDQ